jgi:hypothetical protein
MDASPLSATPSIDLDLITVGGFATGVVVGVVDSSSWRRSKSALLNIRADFAAQAIDCRIEAAPLRRSEYMALKN